MTCRPRVRINRKHDAQELFRDLETNLNLLKRLPEFRTPAVVRVTEEALECAREILTWAPQYDHDYEGEKLTSNGYWTIIIVANKLAQYVLENPRFARYVIEVLDLLTIGFPLLKQTHELSLHHDDGSAKQLHSNSTPLLVDLMHLYLRSTTVIEALCGPACGPHLCESERLTRDAYQTVVSVYAAGNWYEALNCMLSREFRGKLIARFATKFDVSFTKRVLSISDFEPVRTWLPIFSTFFRQMESRNIYVYYQAPYNVAFDKLGMPQLIDCDRSVPLAEGVRVKYLCVNSGRESNNNGQKTLLFCLHGGGFAAQSPETHEFYTRHWAPELKGIPILSVDYSHAPRRKFPFALNEILNVYFWLTDEHNKLDVINQIGFVPERIVLFGDSAGGNQAMSLLMALNDVRQQFPNYKFTMPSSIVTVYAAFNLVPKFAPSYFMTAIDPFLSPMVLFNLIDAYIPVIDAIRGETDVKDMNWSSSYKQNDSGSLLAAAKRCIDWLNPYSSPIDSLDNAWFACDKDELLSRISKFNNLFEHGYLSSIKYANFEQLSDVDLYLITPYFDPLHDDSIEMAKKWKGGMKIDVLDSLSHGFLHFVQFSKEAAEGCDLALHRVKQAMRC